MNHSIYRISLDIHKPDSNVVLNAKRGDTNRKIFISLTDGSVPYHISEECYAVFTATKPDGKIVYNECTIEDCVIIYKFTDQTVAAEGLMDCEIKLYGADNELITSPRFIIMVHGTVYDEGDEVESSDEFSALTKLVADAQQAVENANDAADSANAAADKAAHTAKNLMVIGEAEGANIALDDAIEQHLVGLRIFGKSTQDGTPTPDAPVDIVSVGDSGSITVNVAGDNEVQSMTIATPNGLPGIPVTSGGNYTDANGQQWVCDEVDFCRGVYVQRVDAREITENPSIGVSAYGDAGYYRFVIYDIDTAAGEVTPCMCSHFDDKYQWDRNEEYCYVTGYSSKAYVFSNRWATTSEFAAWLKAQEDAGTPLTFIYVRTYPIETPLSAEELASYAALHTYRGNTVVSNDAGAYMDLEYVMDARKYIDSLIPKAAAGRIVNVNLPASKWTGSGSLYSQVVAIDGITENSQVNLAPSVEQLSIFYDKDITFITENDGGVVTVYVIGQKPQNDYTIQANIVEVIA